MFEIPYYIFIPIMVSWLFELILKKQSPPRVNDPMNMYKVKKSLKILVWTYLIGTMLAACTSTIITEAHKDKVKKLIKKVTCKTICKEEKEDK